MAPTKAATGSPPSLPASTAAPARALPCSLMMHVMGVGVGIDTGDDFGCCVCQDGNCPQSDQWLRSGARARPADKTVMGLVESGSYEVISVWLDTPITDLEPAGRSSERQCRQARQFFAGSRRLKTISSITDFCSGIARRFPARSAAGAGDPPLSGPFRPGRGRSLPCPCRAGRPRCTCNPRWVC